MKKIIYLLAMVWFVAACSSEDELTGKIVIDQDFKVEDNPNDPIQHARYEIYKEYGVPVYFNDTIAVRQTGTDWHGKPIMHYETVDMNWGFDSYDQALKYRYVFIDKEEQLSALDFVREYLQLISKRMRPFSILLVDEIQEVSKRNGEEQIENAAFKIGFRTVALAGVTGLESNEIEEKARNVIRDMVASKVSADKNVCDRFQSVSGDNHWYGKDWSDLGGCNTYLTYLEEVGYTCSANYLFYGDPYNVKEGDTYMGTVVEALMSPYNYPNEELGLPVTDRAVAEKLRDTFLSEIGAYGFLKAGITQYNTPEDHITDRNDYVAAIMHLGDTKFRERYGECPVIMQKYLILYNFITEELGVELK